MSEQPTWAELPGPLRWKTVDVLRSRISFADQEALRHEMANGWPPESWTERYPGWGVEVCEILRREVAPDDKLPGQGWRDYWQDAVHAAIERRARPR